MGEYYSGKNNDWNLKRIKATLFFYAATIIIVY